LLFIEQLTYAQGGLTRRELLWRWQNYSSVFSMDEIFSHVRISYIHGRRQEGSCPPWIFMHDTDKVEGGLMVRFFGLVFSVGTPLEIFLSTSLVISVILYLCDRMHLARKTKF